MNRNFLSKGNILFIIILAFIGICYLIISIHTPLEYDDLYYKGLYPKIVEKYNFLAYPAFIAMKSIHTNARMADNLLPLCLNIMPEGLFAFLNAVFTSLMIALIVKFSCLKQSMTLKFFTIILITFTLPWNSLLIHACWLNYIWAALFSLFAFYLLLYKQDFLSKQKGFRLFGCCCFLFFASSMHESAGLPLTLGVIFFLYVNRKQFHIYNKSLKASFISFILGGFFVISSPASYTRLVHNGVVIDSFIEIVLANCWVFLMILFFSVLFFIPSQKHKINKFFKSDNMIFAIAAIVSSAMSLISHLVIRSAWFADIFALIVIVRYVSQLNISISKTLKQIVSMVSVALIIVHFSMFTCYQCRLDKEYDYAIEQYLNSPDGVVAINYIKEEQIPYMISHKTLGIYNTITDDFYRNQLMAYYNKPTEIKIIESY